MEAHQRLHPDAVDPQFRVIHLVVIGHHGLALLEVPLEQAVNGTLQIEPCLTGHGDDLVAQGREGLVELAENMGCVRVHGSWGQPKRPLM